MLKKIFICVSGQGFFLGRRMGRGTYVEENGECRPCMQISVQFVQTGKSVCKTISLSVYISLLVYPLPMLLHHTHPQWRYPLADTPFGQLPIFETEGVIFCQSNAIARYLARKFGK